MKFNRYNKIEKYVIVYNKKNILLFNFRVETFAYTQK